MHRASHRGRGLVATALAGLAALACAGSAGDAIQPWDVRERIARIEVGQPADAARARLGRHPVHRPGRPGEPLPSPLREIAFETPRGEAVVVELYVVEAHADEACAVVRTEPVAFVDGAVAAVGWDAVEAAWRGWGGALETLRAARDGRACPPA